MRSATILLVDDDPPVRRAVARALTHEGHHVIEAATGRDGIALADRERPAVIVLELGLPDVSGLEVFGDLRRRSRVPIIVLSARDSEGDKVHLLNAGADDYVTKPFSLRELAARVRVQLRRSSPIEGVTMLPPIETTNVRIDFAGRRVRRRGEEVRLTRTEWSLLSALAAAADRPLTHGQLLAAVWGVELETSRAEGQLHRLRVHLAGLRRKIEPDPLLPSLIVTERGLGYRLGIRVDAGSPSDGASPIQRDQSPEADSD